MMAFLSETEIKNIIIEGIGESKELKKLNKLEEQNAATWIETGTSEEGEGITVTRDAESGKNHYIVGVIATYGNEEAYGILDVSEGETVKISGYATDRTPLVIMLSRPYKAEKNTAVSAVLAAGGEGAIGKVNLIGFTA
jgi:hypothetical protein